MINELLRGFVYFRPDEVKDRPDAAEVNKPGSTEATSSLRRKREPPGSVSRPSVEARGNLFFENVLFNYSEYKPVLRRISFQVAAGQSVAVIGLSGAGKTTLLNLSQRFYDPNAGAVLLEGVDLRQLGVKDLRAQIALVLQEPIILPATIAGSIAYDLPDAKQNDIEATARAANAEEFICRLPVYHKPRVGEEGARSEFRRKAAPEPRPRVLEERSHPLDG